MFGSYDALEDLLFDEEFPGAQYKKVSVPLGCGARKRLLAGQGHSGTMLLVTQLRACGAWLGPIRADEDPGNEKHPASGVGELEHTRPT